MDDGDAFRLSLAGFALRPFVIVGAIKQLTELLHRILRGKRLDSTIQRLLQALIDGL